MHTRLKSALVLVHVSFLSGCAIVGGPNISDLKLVSVEIVDLKDRVEVRSLADPRPSRPLVLINFSSQADLPQISREDGYNIYFDASICTSNAFDAAKAVERDPAVYDEQGQIHFGRTVGASPRSSGPKPYHVFVDVRSSGSSGGARFTYDLRRDPQDVCIKLGGGKMLGGSFSSNVLIISKAVLLGAISRSTVR